MKRRLWLLGLFVAVIVVLAAVAAISRRLDPEKSFSLPRVAIDASLRENGSMDVVEHITYDFKGSFSFGTRPIPAGSYRVTNVTVSENGSPLTSIGAPYNLRWFFDATDEQRTFDISYTVEDAVGVGPDVTELYWKWVGEDHPAIGRVDVALAVPPGSGQLRAWGHGPLDGVVNVEADSVDWRARSVPEGTFVEGRVAIPTARMPALTPAGGPRLATIIAEERAWIASTRASMLAATKAERDKHNRRDTLQWLAPLVALLGALGFLLAWRRWGREPPRPANVGKYYRDLPDDPPAVVDALMHWGDVRPNAFGATLLHLAQRGYLTVTQHRVDRGILPDHIEYEYTLAESARGIGDEGVVARNPRLPMTSLHPAGTVVGEDEDEDDDQDDGGGDDGPPAPRELRRFEQVTLEQVFAAGPVVTQSELLKRAKRERTESSDRWSKFETSVERSLRARGYLRGDRPLPYVVNVVLASIVALVGVAALALEAWVGGAIALTWAITQLWLTALLRQRTPKGQERYFEWLGVRNYLRDFSQLDHAPAGHLVLWERYLVFAVALGVSDQLARGLAAHLPADQVSNFAAWYGSDSGGPAYGSIGSFSAEFAHSAPGSIAPASSGDGAGGAFSGGGGGGGGGGGIGAG